VSESAVLTGVPLKLLKSFSFGLSGLNLNAYNGLRKDTLCPSDCGVTMFIVGVAAALGKNVSPAGGFAAQSQYGIRNEAAAA
jgi:hypothetical protein